MNYIRNDGFYDLSSYWQSFGNATFDAAEGNDQLGAVRLATVGDGVEQTFTIPDRPNWTFDTYFKASGDGNVSVAIVNDDNDTVYSSTVSVTTSWALDSNTIKLPKGVYTLTFTYVDVTVWVDDVSLAYIPKTRQQLADLCHARVQDLVVDAITAYTAPMAAPASEGSWVEPLNDALFYVGAVNQQNEPDIRYLEAHLVNDVVDRAVQVVETGIILNYWQTQNDYSLGPRRETKSQIASSIRQRYGLVPGATHSGPRRMQVIDLSH